MPPSPRGEPLGTAGVAVSLRVPWRGTPATLRPPSPPHRPTWLAGHLGAGLPSRGPARQLVDTQPWQADFHLRALTPGPGPVTGTVAAPWRAAGCAHQRRAAACAPSPPRGIAGIRSPLTRRAGWARQDGCGTRDCVRRLPVLRRRTPWPARPPSVPPRAPAYPCRLVDGFATGPGCEPWSRTQLRRRERPCGTPPTGSPRVSPTPLGALYRCPSLLRPFGRSALRLAGLAWSVRPGLRRSGGGCVSTSPPFTAALTSGRPAASRDVPMGCPGTPHRPSSCSARPAGRPRPSSKRKPLRLAAPGLVS